MFPSSSESLPTLAVRQMHYRGLTFSGTVHGTNYQYQSLVGIDNPPIVSGDVQRALDQGEQAGLDVYQGRDITLQQAIVAKRGQSSAAADLELEEASQAMGAVMAVAGDTEYPLYIQRPSGLYACMARPRKHNFTEDINMVLAKGGVATSLWHATDPRWYSCPTQLESVGLPEPSGTEGLKFPLEFPLSFGGGSAGGILECNNAGSFEMRPILTFTGPCKNPVVQSLLIPGEPSLGFNITLEPGDTLVLGTDYQTVIYTPNGSPFGAPARKTAMKTNTWFNFPPGMNKLLFTTSDSVAVAGTLTAEWASARPSL
jgi:hypothetical protein